MLDLLESIDGYRQHFMNQKLWQPYVESVCQQHKLPCRAVRPGRAGTFPAFIVDEHWVVKFFGPLFDGETCWQVEKEAAEWMATLPEIPTATLLAAGILETTQSWRYLIFDFVAGISIGEIYEQVSFEDNLALARWLGVSLHRLHALDKVVQTTLPCLSEARMRGWFTGRWPEDQKMWPVHLAGQVEAYLDANAAFVQSSATHFVHADLTCDHILGKLEKGRWSTLALIDFGDAMIGNIFYELVALQLDLFGCDKRLLEVFLTAYDLPAGERKDFVRKAMTTALMHQFDVFGPLFKWEPSLAKIHSLEELASRLWNVNAN